MYCTVFIDGREIRTITSSNLLQVALDAGIYIPHLCYRKELTRPAASCRLCFVSIKGKDEPVTACTEMVVDGMIVNTRTDEAISLRRTAFELLMSNHQTECSRCQKNRQCELQRIARSERLRLRQRRYSRIDPNLAIDDSHNLFTFNPNKCVLCGKCIIACREKGSAVLSFTFRGIRTRVSTFMDIPLLQAGCSSCLACVDVCPVGAFSYKKMESCV